MPRSSQIDNYPTFFQELHEAMSTGIDTINFDLDAKTAYKWRHMFYSYLKALEIAAQKAKKEGNVSVHAERKSMVRAMRGYAATILTRKGTPAKPGIDPKTPCNLIFINRDREPEALNMEEQLKKQMETHVPLSIDVEESQPSSQIPNDFFEIDDKQK